MTLLETENEALRSELEAADADADEGRALIEDLERTTATLRRSLADAETDLEAALSRVDANARRAAAAEAAATGATTAKAAAAAELADLASRLDAATTVAAADAAAAAARVADADASAAAARVEATAAHAAADEARAELAALRGASDSRLDGLEAAAAGAAAALAAAEARAEEGRRAAVAATDRAHEAAAQAAAAEERAAAAEARAAAAEAALGMPSVVDGEGVRGGGTGGTHGGENGGGGGGGSGDGDASVTPTSTAMRCRRSGGTDAASRAAAAAADAEAEIGALAATVAELEHALETKNTELTRLAGEAAAVRAELADVRGGAVAATGGGATPLSPSTPATARNGGDRLARAEEQLRRLADGSLRKQAALEAARAEVRALGSQLATERARTREAQALATSRAALRGGGAASTVLDVDRWGGAAAGGGGAPGGAGDRGLGGGSDGGGGLDSHLGRATSRLFGSGLRAANGPLARLRPPRRWGRRAARATDILDAAGVAAVGILRREPALRLAVLAYALGVHALVWVLLHWHAGAAEGAAAARAVAYALGNDAAPHRARRAPCLVPFSRAPPPVRAALPVEVPLRGWPSSQWAHVHGWHAGRRYGRVPCATGGDGTITLPEVMGPSRSRGGVGKVEEGGGMATAGGDPHAGATETARKRSRLPGRP